MSESFSFESHPVFSIFKRLNDIPRCSNREDRIAQELISIGTELELKTETDAAGNVSIVREADPGYEAYPRIILQGHMDMVCVKDPDSDHDFLCDPIAMVEESGWVHAQGTTLGADNGIGLAMALALLQENKLPSIRVLATRSEETGMDGAIGLSEGFLDADYLINLDSEEEGYVTCACAGGSTGRIELPVERVVAEGKLSFLEIVLSRLHGGHSGMEIANLRANAIKVMSSLLRSINEKQKINLHTFSAGSKHNAIPSSARAIISYPSELENDILKIINRSRDRLIESMLKLEPDIQIDLFHKSTELWAITDESKNRLFSFIELVPHGVYTMNPDNKTVETSDNLAIVHLEEDVLTAILSVRSSSRIRLQDLQKNISSIAEMNKGSIRFSDGYLAWELAESSRLRNIFLEQYEQLTGERAIVLSIHAGLECGLFAEKNPHLDMISFGPDIVGAHTTKEKVSVDSVDRSYTLLKAIIARLATAK